jgi:hypothetical protein
MSYTLYWIFGGTAVGKKTYIQLASEKIPSLKPTWIKDGDKPVEEVLSELDNSDLLVRWQWTREYTLAELAEVLPRIEQRVWLLETLPEVQALRARAREPKVLRSLEELTQEAANVSRLARWIAAYYELPLITVDVNNKDKSTWILPQ